MTPLGRFLVFFPLFSAICYVTGCLFVFPVGVGCGSRDVRIAGRILDAHTGRPLPGVEVMPALSRRMALDEDAVRFWHRMEEPFGDDAEQQDQEDRALTTTDAGGRFVVHVEAWTCTTTYGVFGLLHVREGDGPRRGARFLRVQRPMQAPVVMPMPVGTWTGAARPAGGGARWDVGDVRVP